MMKKTGGPMARRPVARGLLPATAFVVAIVVNGFAAADHLNAPPGALSCSGCHPAGSAVDSPVTRLDGRDAAGLAEAVIAFKTGKVPATVMDRIAKGFSDDEIRAIAAWYAQHKE